MFQAFEIGPFIFWTRLLFVLAGIILSTEFFLRLAHTANLSLQHFREKGMLYVCAFLLGGRLSAILAEYQAYFKDPVRIFIFWDGGFNFLGGAIGIAAVLAWATRGHRSTFLQWLDALLPATCLGLVFEWMGAFFSGHAYGRPTEVFWSVTYDAMNVRYSVPIHPVQLYFAVFYLLLTFLLLVIRKKAKRVGTETLAGIFCAAVATFFLEYFRGDIGILVFATQIDILLLIALFLSLGIFAAMGPRLSPKVVYIYEACLLLMAVAYVFLRPFLDLDTYELRFSQLLALMALLGAGVYVLDHRRRFPYL
ncbi:MAG: prolipoprotein diacylglyceryl transferase family protein [Candidatus Peribacteraceae bacterium]